MFREPHQFVQRVVDDEQALAVEDNPHIAAAGAGYFLLCKTAVFDAAGHIVRLKEQAVAEKITGKESIALICCAKHVAKRDAVLCCWNDASRPTEAPCRFPPFKSTFALGVRIDCCRPSLRLVQTVTSHGTDIARPLFCQPNRPTFCHGGTFHITMHKGRPYSTGQALIRHIR